MLIIPTEQIKEIYEGQPLHQAADYPLPDYPQEEDEDQKDG